MPVESLKLSCQDPGGKRGYGRHGLPYGLQLFTGTVKIVQPTTTSNNSSYIAASLSNDSVQNNSVIKKFSLDEEKYSVGDGTADFINPSAPLLIGFTRSCMGFTSPSRIHYEDRYDQCSDWRTVVVYHLSVGTQISGTTKTYLEERKDEWHLDVVTNSDQSVDTTGYLNYEREAKHYNVTLHIDPTGAIQGQVERERYTLEIKTNAAIYSQVPYPFLGVLAILNALHSADSPSRAQLQ